MSIVWRRFSGYMAAPEELEIVPALRQDQGSLFERKTD
jgi:hypothetical protein